MLDFDGLHRLRRSINDVHARRLISAGVWAILLIYFAVERIFYEAAGTLDFLSPASLFKLNSAHWQAVFYTCLTTVLSFLFAWFAGYWCGIITAWAARRGVLLRIVSASFETLMEGLYIIPIVLTIAVLYGVMLLQYLNADWWKPSVLFGTVLGATFILSGFQVFEVIVKSTVWPDARAEGLVRSLHSARVPKGWFRGLKTDYLFIRRLLDHEIESYAQAVIRSFHLAVVAVVIVEMLIPSLYWYVDLGLSNPQAQYGVGGIVIRLQAAANTEVIAGFIWVILIFDSAMTPLISRWLRYRYLQFYRRPV